MRVTALVPAAGRGTRLGTTVPKQFIALNGKPLLLYSLEVLDSSEDVSGIIVAAQAADIGTIRDLVREYRIRKVVDVVQGGEERTQSVRNAFRAIGTADYVLIHDGVRPFITRDIVQRVLAAAVQHGAAISALPVTDTVKFADDDGSIVKNINRHGLWLAQTPQVFRYSILAEAYRHYDEHPVDITDESGLVELTGSKVKTVPGSIFNIKITREEDLLLATMIAGMP